jgi:hypothetical protein
MMVFEGIVWIAVGVVLIGFRHRLIDASFAAEAAATGRARRRPVSAIIANVGLLTVGAVAIFHGAVTVTRGIGVLATMH